MCQAAVEMRIVKLEASGAHDAWNRRPRGFAGRQRSHRSRRHRGQARSRRDRACRGSAVRAWKTGPRRWWNRGKQVPVPRGCRSRWHRSQCGFVVGGRGPHGRPPQRRPARGRLSPSFRALALSVWRLCAFWCASDHKFPDFHTPYIQRFLPNGGFAATGGLAVWAVVALLVGGRTGAPQTGE